MTRRFAAPVFVTLLGAFLRLYRFADFTTNIDHAYPIAQAISLWEHGQWPALGQNTSILFANPPGMSYMVLLPWALLRSVWGAHALVIGLNLLVVPLTYQGMLRLGNTSQAWWAAFLVATNPWTIYHSRGTWVQGLIPLWATLTFVLLLRALFGSGVHRGRRLFAAWLALTALTQMYLLAFLSLAQFGLIALLNVRRLIWRGMIAGAAVFAMATSLYIFALATDWPAQSARLERLTTAAVPLRPRTAALDHALRFVTGRDYEIVYGNDDSTAWQVRRGISLSLSVGLAAAVAAGIVRAAWQIVRRASDAPDWLATLLWWLVPVAAMTVTNQPVHIVYVLISLPAGYLLAAPILARLGRGWVGFALAFIVAATDFLLLNAGNVAVAARPAGAVLDTLSVRALVPFQKTAARLVEDYALTEFYTALDPASLSAKVGRDLSAVNWYQLPEFEAFALGRPAVYIRLEHDRSPAPLPLAERVAVLDYPGGDSIAFDLIPAYSRERLSALPQNRVEWPTIEGLTLVGYDLSPDGQALTCYWVVEALGQGRPEWLYAPYAHLTNGRGEIVANVGAPGLPGYYYRPGDIYVYRIALPELPAGLYQLELGLFDGLHGLGVTFLPPGDGPQPYFLAPVTLR